MEEPLKSRLILEIATDLDGMADHFRARGMSEVEAVSNAEERLVGSPAALQALVRVHTTTLERVALRLAGSLRTGADAILLVAGVLPIGLAGGLAVAGPVTGGGAGPAAWATMALGGLAVTLAARGGWLLCRSPGDRTRVHRAIGDVLYLGVFAIALGATGLTIGLVRIFDLLSSGSGAGSAVMIAESLTATASGFALSLLVGLGSGLMWFGLVTQVARLDRVESAALLAAP